MIVSPTEPPELRELGHVSWACEEYGADVMFVARGRKVGIQRKELKDLLASVESGLLAKQMGMMSALDAAVLVIEGDPRFTTEGVLLGRDYGESWTRQQLWGIEASAQAKGLSLLKTKTLAETVELVKYLKVWYTKPKHTALERRAGPVSKLWGTPLP